MSDQSSILIADDAIEFIRGDITKQQDVDTIVNASYRMPATGGGVAGAIRRAAGPEPAAEAGSVAPICSGEAIITGTHDLPGTHVFHRLGSVYGSERPEPALADQHTSTASLPG